MSLLPGGDPAYEWNKFEKVEGVLKTTNQYMSCYQQLKDAGELVIVGSDGDKAPRHSADESWTQLSEPEKLERLYATARATNAEMAALCEKLSVYSGHVSVGPLKAEQRVIEKRDQDYDGDVLRVIDLVRCSADLASLSHAKRIVDAFKPGGAWASQWAFVRCKDGFEHADNFLAGGYRDIKVNVRHVDNGHIVEVQLHLKAFYHIKNNGGHEHYTFARTLKVEGVTNAVSVLSGLTEDLNWRIARVGEQKLAAAAHDAAACYPIERRLGELYASMWQHGKYAVERYDAALKHCEAALGADSIEASQVLMELVYCVSEMKRHCDRPNMRSRDAKWMSVDLLPMIDRAVDGFTQLLSARHPFTIKAMRIKADVYDSTDRPDEAKPIYYQVLEMQTEILGVSHPDTIETLNNFGDLLSDSDETFAEGFGCYETALAGALKRMDFNHPTARMLAANMLEVLENAPQNIPNAAEKLQELRALQTRQTKAQQQRC